MNNKFETYRKRLDELRPDCSELEQALKMGSLIQRTHSCARCAHFAIMREVGFCNLWTTDLTSLDACATCPRYEDVPEEKRYAGGR